MKQRLTYASKGDPRISEEIIRPIKGAVKIESVHSVKEHRVTVSPKDVPQDVGTFIHGCET